MPDRPDFVKIFTSSVRDRHGRRTKRRKVAVTRGNRGLTLLTARAGPGYNAPLVALPPERRDQQDAWGGYGTAWSIIGTLIAGLAVWGAIGFGIDRLTGFHALFLPIGLVVGAVGGVYLVVVRYGRPEK